MISGFKSYFRRYSPWINNRILNDYHLHDIKTCGKKHFYFFTMIIGVNIHLDARIKVAKAVNYFILLAFRSAHSGLFAVRFSLFFYLRSVLYLCCWRRSSLVVTSENTQ